MSQGMNDLLSSLSVTLSAEDLLLSGLTGAICGEIVSQRIKRGMTQKQFAEFMGVSQSMVSKWESGDCNFTLQSLVHISSKLNIPMQSPFELERFSYEAHSNVVNLPVKWIAYSTPSPTYQSVDELMEN